MRAIHATAAGGPDVLALVDVPEPEPGRGEVVVDVAAAGVNFIDTYRRSGVYPGTFPHGVGSEGAGTVTAVGDGVEDLSPGDRVAWADGAPGSYAEKVRVAAASAVPVPDVVELEDAAAVMLQGMTAHYLVTSVAPVRAGQVVLVHAGAGGVGLLVTQLAVARGARVLSTVSSADKAELSRAAGAEPIRYDGLTDLTAELPALVREATDGAGVPLVLDGVGRSTFDASLACLHRRGMLVLFGAASGPVPPVDPQRLNAAGSVFLTRPKLGDYTATREELLWRSGELFDALTDGSLDVRVGARFPLEEASEAHRALEGRRTTGKVLMLP